MSEQKIEPHGGVFVGTFGSFSVTLVRKGDFYGRGLCLEHTSDDPLVEFYDNRYRNKPGFTVAGQFISRYHLSTLRKHTGGLCLDAAFSDWTLSPATFEAARVAVERTLNP